MSIPGLSLGGHDHYTPEIRDRILEKLRAADPGGTAYQMLTPARLRALAEIEASAATVTSLYMQMTPDRRPGGAWRTFFSSLSDATLKPIQDRRRREEIRSELDRIGQALEAETPGTRSWCRVLLEPEIGFVAADRRIGAVARRCMAQPATLSQAAGADAG